ncbi:MAG: sensor histidine kinase [Clostridia bacterium]|nr:sensor histidine kinase [Clostridia bacterium]
MTLWNEIENMLCMLATYLPSILMAIVPFKGKLRFGKLITSLLIVGLCISEFVLLYLNVHFSISNEVLLALSFCVCSFFAFVAIKAHKGKIMFTLIILANITNCITVCSKWLEKLLFGKEAAMLPMNYTLVICTLITSLLVMIPVFFYFSTHFFNGMSINVNNTPWKYLWIIPTTFYITWIHHLDDSGEKITTIAFDTAHALFFLLLNAGAFFAYHTVIRMLNILSENLELERSNNALTLQTLQHENLKERIAEARRAKHDIRHHIVYLDSCLQNGEYEEAKEYLKVYKKSLPDDSAIVFCEHPVVNSLLLYYAQLSKNNSVDFDVAAAAIPQSTKLPDDVFSVVFGNLLENALDACCEQTEGKRIILLKSKADEDSFFLHIENSYNGEALLSKNGVFVSSKAHGSGLGLASIKAIVQRYNGIFETSQDNGRFAVSVFLNIPQQNQ